MVTMVALSIFASWMRRTENSRLTELKQESEAIAAGLSAHEKRKEEWISTMDFPTSQLYENQSKLLKTIRPFNGSLRSDLPERLWQGDLPLVFVNTIEYSTQQIFLGNVDAKLQVTIEKVTEDENGRRKVEDSVTEATYDLTKNSWSFFELRKPAKPQPYFSYRFLNSEIKSAEFKKVDLEFEKCSFYSDNAQRGLRPLEDFKTGSVPRLLSETQIRQVGNETEYYLVKHFLVLP